MAANNRPQIKEETIAMEFSFELDAMRSEEMPKNLDLADAKMYQALSWLYKRYYAKYITREQAKNEKKNYYINIMKKKSKENMNLSFVANSRRCLKNAKLLQTITQNKEH